MGNNTAGEEMVGEVDKQEVNKFIRSADDWAALKGERILFTIVNTDTVEEATVHSISDSGRYVQLKVPYRYSGKCYDRFEWYDISRVEVRDTL